MIIIGKVLILTILCGFLSTSECADPEDSMNAAEMILYWGYPAEEYTVQTTDGYEIQIQRIPYGKAGKGSGTRPVIFLQHGLECSSTNWIANLPSQSAGFMFADAGFDVWLGNVRGNTYGLKNIHYTKKQHEFWQFSWDEIAQYDLEATINFALQKSGVEQLYYMGHSQGTITAFAKFSSDPEFAKKIKKYFALGPVATCSHIGGALKYLAPFTNDLDFLLKLIGYDQFAPNDWLMKMLSRYVCGTHATEPICGNILFLIAGPNTDQLNSSRVQVFTSHTPAGTSTQNVAHWGQMVLSGKFQKYNYGKRENIVKYGQPTPPLYNLRNMNVPVALFWGDEDVLADPVDVRHGLIPYLPNMIASCEMKGFNHLDFIWGLRAAPEIYQKVINHIHNGEALC